MEKIRLDMQGEFAEEFKLQRLADADEVQINFVRLKAHKSLPAHNTDSNVRLLVLDGEITLTVDGEVDSLGVCEMAAIAFDTPMQIRNLGNREAAFVVIKAPGPGRS